MRERRQPQERRDAKPEPPGLEVPAKPLPGRMGPEDVLRVQALASNRAVARWLMRDPAPAPPVAAGNMLKGAARRVATLSGEGVDKTLEQLTFYVDNGFAEDAVVRAANTIAGLAGKSGAALYTALQKMATADAEAY